MVQVVVGRRRTGVAVDDAIRVGVNGVNPTSASRNGLIKCPRLSFNQSPLCLVSTPASLTRLQFIKGVEFTLS